MTFDLKFVDSIASSPTTRVNLNDGTAINLLIEGTDWGMPELDRAYADTLLVDGAVVPAAAYGNRLLTLRLDFLSSSKDTNATNLQSVLRELDRPNNFLRYVADTSAPVFFRTLRSSMAGVVWDSVEQVATVSVLAEPFAYGLKETLSNATVTNNPAAGSNGQFFDVTGVKGDVETPLFLSIPAYFPGGGATTGNTACIAVRRRGTPSSAPYLVQAESMTLGTDTTLPGNDAVMSGSGSNYARVSFATNAAMATRVTAVGGIGPWAASSTAVRGTYRVFARYRKSVSGDSIQMRFRYDTAGQPVYNTAVTLPSGTARRYADLGLVTFPAGNDVVTDGYSGVEIAAAVFDISIEAARVSGSGNLDIDFLVLVPADDRLALVTWSLSVGPTTYVLDSRLNAAYPLGLSNDIYFHRAYSVIGGSPMISPGVTNRVYFLRNVNGNDDNSDSITSTNVITPYYWPRYVNVARPVST